MVAEVELHFNRLGARKLTIEEILAAQARLDAFPWITPEIEIGRLRARIEKLQDRQMIQDCMKAIAKLSLVEMRTV